MPISVPPPQSSSAFLCISVFNASVWCRRLILWSTLPACVILNVIRYYSIQRHTHTHTHTRNIARTSILTHAASDGESARTKDAEWQLQIAERLRQIIRGIDNINPFLSVPFVSRQVAGKPQGTLDAQTATETPSGEWVESTVLQNGSTSRPPPTADGLFRELTHLITDCILLWAILLIPVYLGKRAALNKSIVKSKSVYSS